VEHDEGMHRLHDVIRAYAAARGLEQDPRSGQLASVQRLLGHYRRWAACAVRLLRLDETSAEDGTDVELAGAEEARAWLEAECENVVATALEAGRLGLADELARLAGILHPWLEEDVRFGEMETLHRAMTDSQIHRREPADGRVPPSGAASSARRGARPTLTGRAAIVTASPSA